MCVTIERKKASWSLPQTEGNYLCATAYTRRLWYRLFYVLSLTHVGSGLRAAVPETFAMIVGRMVRGPSMIGTKIVPSRDHGTSSTAAYPSMASVAGGWQDGSLGLEADIVAISAV